MYSCADIIFVGGYLRRYEAERSGRVSGLNVF